MAKTIGERVAVLETTVTDHVKHCMWWQRAIFGGVMLLVIEGTVRYFIHG